MIAHIAALNTQRVIGVEGQLPWHLPEDLKFFKQKTLEKCIIMGRKTFDSLGKPLPRRKNLVVTRDPAWKAEGCEVFQDIPSAIARAKELVSSPEEEIFIVGGAEIYKQTLALADRLYLTLIEKDVKGDAFYPEWGSDFALKEKRPSEHQGVSYAFCTFERISV